MSFSYDATKIAVEDPTFISAVRWLIQDTDAETVEISDEELTSLYAQSDPNDSQGIRNRALAVLAAQGLERKYRKQASFSAGGASVDLKARAEAWATAVTELMHELSAARMREIGRAGGVIFAGRPPSYSDPVGGGLW